MRGLSNHDHPAGRLLARVQEPSELAKRPAPPITRILWPAGAQHRLSSVEAGELAECYRSGATILDLARRFGVSRTTVMAHLRRAGVETRYNLLEGRVDDAKSLYEQGWSLVQVAAYFDVSAGTVLNAFKRAGVETRPVGTNQWESGA